MTIETVLNSNTQAAKEIASLQAQGWVDKGNKLVMWDIEISPYLTPEKVRYRAKTQNAYVVGDNPLQALNLLLSIIDNNWD